MNRESLVAAVESLAAAKDAHDLDAVVDAYAPSGFYRNAAFGEPIRAVFNEALVAFLTDAGNSCSSSRTASSTARRRIEKPTCC